MGRKTSTHLYTDVFKHGHSHRWLHTQDDVLQERERNSDQQKCWKVKNPSRKTWHKVFCVSVYWTQSERAANTTLDF